MRRKEITKTKTKTKMKMKMKTKRLGWAAAFAP
jgi:hypothetical protein